MKKTRTLSWHIDQREAHVLVTLSGEVNENARLEPLAVELSRLTGKVRLDLSQVRRLNSTGVREWVNFMRLVGKNERIELEYIRCSIPIVSQINMIADFQGPATVTSFFAPYADEDTGDEETRLLIVDDVDPVDPPVFKEDGKTWELDELPERYLLFIKLQRQRDRL